MERSNYKSIDNKFLYEASEFSKSIIKKSIYFSEISIRKVDKNDINLIQVDYFDKLSNND